MDSTELRLECLRLAADRNMPAEDVVRNAERFLDFVLSVHTGRHSATGSGIAPSSDTQHTYRESSRG